MEMNSSLWAISVGPDKLCTATIPDEAECTITNIALDSNVENRPSSGRLVLYLKVNSQPEVAIASFIIDKNENISTELHFSPGDKLTFRTSGTSIPVHICGLIFNAFALNTENCEDISVIPT